MTPTIPLQSDLIPLPDALRNDEISEKDVEKLLAIAKNPNALKGRLKIKPVAIPVESAPQELERQK